MNDSASILIVDDEENIRFAFEMFLSEKGHDVMTAPDFDTAIAHLSNESPDVVITDIILGGHTGIDLLAEIKKRGLWCPVIMITGQPDIETSSNALRLGAFDYVPKPIRKETLLRVTDHALRHKKLLDNKLALEKENLKVRKNMEAIFASLNDGVITVDDNLNVIEANPAAEKICSLQAPKMIGRPVKNFMTDCDGACLDILARTINDKLTISDHQIECARKGKNNQIVRLTCTPLQSDDINFSGAVLVIRNVTKLATLEKELAQRYQFHRIIGKSNRMQTIYNLLESLADTDTTVLITGESGTGKELIADAIHHNSTRKNGPFIKVNCSALSENLLESELFGHVKGAFTGAIKDKIGRFELADKGTIFLDEIGEISPLVQLKLLRVIQERSFERVGDAAVRRTDVRVLAATNRNLAQKVNSGEFREDLYYRIKVLNIELPSLRERKEDIPLLLDHFMDKFNKRFGKQVYSYSDEVLEKFMTYSWPGNIRELEHAVEHAFVLCRQTQLQAEHLPEEVRRTDHPQKTIHTAGDPINREALIDALTKAGGNKAKAARRLGIGRRTIYRKLEAFGIDTA